MTDPQTPVDDLEGRGLDAAVAEEVFGLGVRWLEWHTFGEMPFSVDRPPHAPHHYERLDEGDPAYPGITVWFVENYSTDIAAAWEVVGVFGDVEVHTHANRDVWRCWLRRGGSGKLFGAAGETAPLAICRAALRAVRE